MPLRDWILGLVGRAPKQESSAKLVRGQATHVILLDGTLSTLMDGCETNVGLIYKLLSELGPTAQQTVYYEAGIQWRDWSGAWEVMTGKGINRQIRRAYGALASRYRAGDKIILIGYSRGAYAVRSLAGVIDRVGLLRADYATVSNIRTAYRHYEAGGTSEPAKAFRAAKCHDDSPIEAVAVFDTVKALGLRLPGLWRFTQAQHAFHDHTLGPTTRNGFHAVAMDEKRVAYSPVMWMCPTDYVGHMEQVWFRGNHGDIGGQISGREDVRPLSNIPLVWMMERLNQCGMVLPEDALQRFPQDENAPSTGPWHGWSKYFLYRRKRQVGVCRSERVHKTAVSPINAKSTVELEKA